MRPTTAAATAQIQQQTGLGKDYYQIHLQLPAHLPLQAGDTLQLHHPSMTNSVTIPIHTTPNKAHQLDGYYRAATPDSKTLLRLPNHTNLACVPQQNTTQNLSPQPKLTLILAENEYLASAILLGRSLQQQKTHQPIILWSLTTPPPIPLIPSQFIIPGIPATAIAAIPLLEDLGIPSRIQCPDTPGCYQNNITELLHYWQHHNQTPYQTLSFGPAEFIHPILHRHILHRHN